MNKTYNTELLPEEVIQCMKKNIFYNYLHFTSFSHINQRYLSLRSSIFSLIHKISNKMNFKSSTYFLSIYYLDILFLKDKIPDLYEDNWELLGLTCLVLAAKHLENDPTVPHLKYFINSYNYIIKQIIINYQSDNFFNYPNISFNDLFQSEVIVCKMLNYKLNYFTIYDFNSFFFGHGILKIEQLADITEDFDSKLDEENRELNYINPEMVKRILEKIYKKSRYYLDNVVKNKICLKYNSFLLSIYIMNKSVEYVILKENKNLSTEKNIEKYYIEKKQEILRRKTSKCFKDIMKDIYKIDLDNIEEYQYLINDDEIMKSLFPLKINNSILNNNKNEFDVSDKLDKIHRKFQSNNIAVTDKKSKVVKTEKNEIKNFSPKKLSHMKIPSEKYNKIRRLKILERLNKDSKTSKNKFIKSFIFMNSKDNISHNKINTSINNKTNKRQILSKSNLNNDYNYYNNKNKTINVEDNKSKFIESYGTKQSKQDSSLIKNLNLKDSLFTDNNLYFFPTLDAERDRDKKISKINLDDSQFNKSNINLENSSNNNLININEKLNKILTNSNLSIVAKPYSKKVIQKIEKKKNINKTKNFDININTNINKSNISFNQNINKNYTSKNFDLRSSNPIKFKNIMLEPTLNDSVEVLKDCSNSNYGRINLNMVKSTKDNEMSSSKPNNKIRAIQFQNKNSNKLSMSVNKVKVNGVSSKHKLNKKLIFGMHKTPMKTENILKNVIKRNIGVKRENNISILNKNNNSLDNSIEDHSKITNISKNENKNLSYLNFTGNNELNIEKIETNKKVINLKNEISNKLGENDNSNNDIRKEEDKSNEIYSSSDGEEFYENENDNNFELSGIRINQYSDNNLVKYIKKIKDDTNKIKFKNKRNINDEKNKIKKKVPKIELIQINKKKSPTIVINNNINVNFENKKIGEPKKFARIKNFKI